jgi:D-glycero-D-manno-heptose 1,7-bisphosphate phosphatase
VSSVKSSPRQAVAPGASTALGREVRWIFLDRDGTINAGPARGEYVTTPGELELLDGAAEAIRRLNEAGIWVGIITNQRGVALGRMSMADLNDVNARLLAELSLRGAHVDGVYVCPHEQGTCTCRKPLPGLLLQAQQDNPDMNFSQAVVIGDSPADVQAGRAVGARTVLLAGDRDGAVGADLLAPSLAAAIEGLLA